MQHVKQIAISVLTVIFLRPCRWENSHFELLQLPSVKERRIAPWVMLYKIAECVCLRFNFSRVFCTVLMLPFGCSSELRRVFNTAQLTHGTLSQYHYFLPFFLHSAFHVKWDTFFCLLPPRSQCVCGNTFGHICLCLFVTLECLDLEGLLGHRTIVGESYILPSVLFCKSHPNMQDGRSAIHQNYIILSLDSRSGKFT